MIAIARFWLGTKKHGNGNVQANVRANNSGQFEGTAHENVGFRGRKGQKVHPNFAPKAKSGNLNLFLCILPFFPFFSLYFAMKKGQTAQKKV